MREFRKNRNNLTLQLSCLTISAAATASFINGDYSLMMIITGGWMFLTVGVLITYLTLVKKWFGPVTNFISGFFLMNCLAVLILPFALFLHHPSALTCVMFVGGLMSLYFIVCSSLTFIDKMDGAKSDDLINGFSFFNDPRRTAFRLLVLLLIEAIFIPLHFFFPTIIFWTSLAVSLIIWCLLMSYIVLARSLAANKEDKIGFYTKLYRLLVA